MASLLPSAAEDEDFWQITDYVQSSVNREKIIQLHFSNTAAMSNDQWYI